MARPDRDAISARVIVMSDELKKLLELLRCVVLVIETVNQLFPDWAGTFEDFEDAVLNRIQDLR